MKVRRNLIELFQYTEALGWLNGLFIFTRVKTHFTRDIRVQGVRFPLTLRSPSSDINAFRQVFVFKEYEMDVPFEPRFIIDAGSNIGLASIFFANKFPGATIVSIEPESKNFKLMEVNTARYENVKPLQSGVWNNSVFLKVRDIGLGNWGFIVEEQTHEDADTFRAISIGDVMAQFHQNQIDILKLDVEGAEKEIFTSNYENWLPHTRILIVETHDRMKKGCSAALFKALGKYDFFVYQLGENLICIQNSPGTQI